MIAHCLILICGLDYRTQRCACGSTQISASAMFGATSGRLHSRQIGNWAASKTVPGRRECSLLVISNNRRCKPYRLPNPPIVEQHFSSRPQNSKDEERSQGKERDHLDKGRQGTTRSIARDVNDG
jgi:hypothetical protein